MNVFIYNIITEIALYDWKYLLSYFQKYNLYHAADSTTKESVLVYLASDEFWSQITDKWIYQIQTELQTYFAKLQALAIQSKTMPNIQQEIQGYNILIEDLKGQMAKNKKSLDQLDSTIDISKWEKIELANYNLQLTINQLTKQLTDAKNKIATL